MATREASGVALNAIAKNLLSLFGGSADLASSNKDNPSRNPAIWQRQLCWSKRLVWHS